jgi:adenylate cyclase
LALVLASGYAWQFDSDPKVLDRAEVLARKAVSLDDSNSYAYAVLGWVIVLKNRPDEGITTAERAITLDPNNAFAYGILAEIWGIADKPPGVRIAYAQKAMRLDPSHPEFYLFEIGWVYLAMQHYREAADALRGALPNDPYTHVGLADAYFKLGRAQDARAEVAEVVRLSPEFPLAEFRKRVPAHWDSPGGRRLLDDLRKAGLK